MISVTVQHLDLNLHLLNLFHHRQFPFQQIRRDLPFRSEVEHFPGAEGFHVQGLMSMPYSRF